ncbi:MAG: small conductance mechanosensitive channel [Myxococcota bacterium]|jgi:small conductance mechanosensitive channel
MPDSINYQAIWDYGSEVIIALLIGIFGLLAASWAQRVVGSVCERSSFDKTLSRFFSKMARWAVLGATVMIVLGEFGVDVGSFAIVLGAMGFAIGMALQGTLGHFAAGVMLLIFRPFKIGDAINVAGASGIVFDIGLFSTAIDTFDNRRLIVPNSNVFGETIENISHHGIRRAQADVGAGYDADIDTTRAIFEKVVKDNPYRLASKEGDVILTELGDSSVNWCLRVWCKREDFILCKQQILRDAKLALEAANIDLPYPQLQIHNS